MSDAKETLNLLARAKLSEWETLTRATVTSLEERLTAVLDEGLRADPFAIQALLERARGLSGPVRSFQLSGLPGIPTKKPKRKKREGSGEDEGVKAGT